MMLLPIRRFIPCVLMAAALTLAGCKTIYTDVYSPKPRKFTPPKEKIPEAPSQPINSGGGAAPEGMPGLPGDPGLLPPAPADPGMNAIPGLGPAPDAGMPAMM